MWTLHPDVVLYTFSISPLYVLCTLNMAYKHLSTRTRLAGLNHPHIGRLHTKSTGSSSPQIPGKTLARPTSSGRKSMERARAAIANPHGSVFRFMSRRSNYHPAVASILDEGGCPRAWKRFSRGPIVYLGHAKVLNEMRACLASSSKKAVHRACDSTAEFLPGVGMISPFIRSCI